MTAAYIAIAVGTVTTRDSHVPFDGQHIFTSDDILTLEELPRSLAVVGAGVIGLVCATVFSALGVRITLIDKRPRLLSFLDAEITDNLIYLMRQDRVTLRLGEGVRSLEHYQGQRGEQVGINLESGKQVITHKALYSVGRTGATSPRRRRAGER